MGDRNASVRDDPWDQVSPHNPIPMDPETYAGLRLALPDPLVPILPAHSPCCDDVLDDTSTPHTEAELRRIYDGLLNRSFTSLRTPLAILEELARLAPEASPFLEDIEKARLALSARIDTKPRASTPPAAPVVTFAEEAPTPQGDKSLSPPSQYWRVRNTDLKSLLEKGEARLARGTPNALEKARLSFQECYQNNSSTRWHGCFGLARVCAAQRDPQNAALYLSRILKSNFAGKALQLKARALLETLQPEISP